MKKIYNIILVFTIGLFLVSCSNEEDDLFSESAAQRLNNSVDKYQKLLESSPKGWVMEFFPSDGSYGGWVYTAKFTGGDVAMAGELSLSNSSTGEEWPAGTTLTSKYSVKAEQSVILTFDTYNLLFHFFSEPQGSSDVDGYESDYEFVFLKTSADQDTIYLRGKKYQNEMRMVKLQSDSKDYINKVLQNDTLVSFAPRNEIIVNSKSYPVDLSDKQFSFTNVDSANVVTKIPYIYNEHGFRLYQPIEINGKEYQNFVYDDATGDVKSTDGTAVIPLPSKADQFFNAKNPWYFQMNDESYDMSKDLYTNFYKAMHYSSSYTFIGASIDNDEVAADVSKGFKKAIHFQWDLFGIFYSNAYYGIDLKLENEAENIYSITGLGAGNGYTASRLKYLDPSVKMILENSPYKVEFNNSRIISTAKFVSTKNSGVWFTLKLNSTI